jgi:hypothetical protein
MLEGDLEAVTGYVGTGLISGPDPDLGERGRTG